MRLAGVAPGNMGIGIIYAYAAGGTDDWVNETPSVSHAEGALKVEPLTCYSA